MPRLTRRVVSASGLLAFVGGCNLIFGLEERHPFPPEAGIGDASCFDGAKNGDETSPDCGGGACLPCKDGDGCEVGPDCESRVCIGGTCVESGCTDQVKNGEEIDVDCGGLCPKCGPDQVCTRDPDCKSNACVNGFCQSTCSDTAKGGDETGVDCGGSDCPACPNGEGCAVGPDCESGVCKVELCVDYHVWSKRFGGSGAMDNVSNPRIAVDSSGNAALVSGIFGAVELGGGPLTGGNDSDVGIASFDVSGNYLGSKSYGDSGHQAPSNVAVANSDSIVTVGYFTGTIFFDSLLASAGSRDIFVARLSASGVPLSSSRFGDAQTQEGHDVALDSLENIHLIGVHEGTVDFGGSLLTSAGGNDYFIAKLDPLGNQLWSKGFGDAQYQYLGDVEDCCGSIAVDGAGNVLAAGSFQGAINFGGDLFTNGGGKDMFVVKLDSAGNHLWSKRFGDNQPQTVIDGNVAVDGSGNVLLSGYFEGTIDFGGEPLTSAGLGDFYVAKLDAFGNHLWSKRFGGVTHQSGCDLAVDGVGNVLLVGNIDDTVDFGGGPLLNAGGVDVFVAKLDRFGNHLWSRRFGDFQAQYGHSIASYDSENVLIAGTFKGSIDFGGRPLVNTGGEDLFLAKLRTP